MRQPVPQAAAMAPKLTDKSRQSSWQALPWLLPSLAGILVFNAVPTIAAFVLSFCRWDMLGPVNWVGMTNYAQLLTTTAFWHSLWVTLTFVVLTVGLELGTGFAVALGVYHLGQRWAWLKVLYFLPFVTPMVSMAMVWGWFYEPNGGLFNQMAGLLHLPAVPWLYQPQTALLAILLFRLWKQLGYTVLLIAAGLEALPESLLEAARLEGLSLWQQVRHILLPLLAPVLVVVSVTCVIQAFQAFDVIYLLTQGGPDHATEVVVYKVFKLAFEQFQVGPASAMAYVLFMIILALSLLQFWWKRQAAKA
jgi:multiple sugar transport system permease protein